LSGQMDSAVVERVRAYQNDSTYIINLTMGPRILWKAGRIAEMRALLRQGPPLGSTLFLLAAVGDTAEAMSRLRAAQQTTPRPRSLDLSTAFTMLGKGDTAEALAALERTVDDKEQEWATIESTLDPMYDSVRQSARFRALMRRLGLEAGPEPSASVPPRR